MGPPTVVHDTSSLICDADVPSFFFQLSNCSLLNCLPCIDQSCWEFYDDLVDGRPVLLLQKNLGAIHLIQNGDDIDTVDMGVCRSCLRFD